MKIIITEEQFNFLFESNFEKNSRLVYKMWNDGMEFNEISDYTGLSLEQIISPADKQISTHIKSIESLKLVKRDTSWHVLDEDIVEKIPWQVILAQ